MGGEMSEPISGISEVQSLRISFYLPIEITGPLYLKKEHKSTATHISVITTHCDALSATAHRKRATAHYGR